MPRQTLADLGNRATACLRTVSAWLAAALEAVVSRRGLAVAFLAGAALLTYSGWLRPPISRDISSLHLPLGVLMGHGQSAETILRGPRHIPWDSAGVLLSLLLATGACVVLWSPRRFGLVAGVLLTAAIAVNAAACLNHPALIELMEGELTEHHHIVLALDQRYENSLSSFDNGRIPESTLNGPVRPLLEGWPYLLYGKWFVVLAAVGVVYGGRRSLARRFNALAGWSVLGVALSCLLCLPRLAGEYFWHRADCFELQADYGASRHTLDRAVFFCPELGRLERTWRLYGRLDYNEGRSTPELRFWQASQFAAGGSLRMAVGLMEDVMKEAGKWPAVREQSARFLADMGCDYLERGDFGGAGALLRRAAQAQPGKFDCDFCLGVVEAQMDRNHPEQAAAQLASFLERCADRALKADALNVLGDAYFDAGTVEEARNRYRQSIDLFDLPNMVNIRAQKGLGGL